MSEFSLSELWGDVIIEREHSFLSFLLCFIFSSSAKLVMKCDGDFLERSAWSFILFSRSSFYCLSMRCKKSAIVSVLHFHLSQREWEAIIAWFPFQLKSRVGQNKSFRNTECVCTILYSIWAI